MGRYNVRTAVVIDRRSPNGNLLSFVMAEFPIRERQLFSFPFSLPTIMASSDTRSIRVPSNTMSGEVCYTNLKIYMEADN